MKKRSPISWRRIRKGMSKYPLGQYRDRIGLNVEMVYKKVVAKADGGPHRASPASSGTTWSGCAYGSWGGRRRNRAALRQVARHEYSHCTTR